MGKVFKSNVFYSTSKHEVFSYPSFLCMWTFSMGRGVMAAWHGSDQGNGRTNPFNIQELTVPLKAATGHQVVPHSLTVNQLQNVTSFLLQSNIPGLLLFKLLWEM